MYDVLFHVLVYGRLDAGEEQDVEEGDRLNDLVHCLRIKG